MQKDPWDVLTLSRCHWVGFQDSRRPPPGHAPAIFIRGGCDHPERRVNTGRLGIAPSRLASLLPCALYIHIDVGAQNSWRLFVAVRGCHSGYVQHLLCVFSVFSTSCVHGTKATHMQGASLMLDDSSNSPKKERWMRPD